EAIRNDTVFTNIMDTAISYYSKVIMIDSNNISASYQRGYSYHYLGDSLNCYKDYKKACDLGDNLSCDIINKEHY
ncbi:MAG: hypothetical protein HRT73_11125, partial [Flavobacteriales bacterium]|nr:hypothetical protein [Flavobacteriales bacterium]